MSELGVPLGENIYDYLRNLLDSEKIIPIFMLSQNYYSSAACLNEMGAVWIKQYKYYTILLPGFQFQNIKGAIDPRQMAIGLSTDDIDIENGLIGLKNGLCKIFNVNFGERREKRWNRALSNFIAQLHKFSSIIKIDLNESDVFCIGYFDLDVATLDKDDALNKIKSNFDFSKTKADLCSLVFYLNCLNLSNKVNNHGKLKFSLKASRSISAIVVEFQIGTKDSPQSVHQFIHPEDYWQQYVIDLSKMGGHFDKWKCCRECNFLLYRSKVNGDIGVIEVKDIEFD